MHLQCFSLMRYVSVHYSSCLSHTHTHTQLDSELGDSDDGVPEKVIKQDGMSMSGPCLLPKSRTAGIFHVLVMGICVCAGNIHNYH